MTFVAAMLFTACDVKDPIYDTSHPDKAQITVTVDWNGIDPNITKPAEYTAVLNETKYQNIPTAKESYTFPDFAPGTYTAYLYNEVAQIPVAGNIATADYTKGTLDWLFTGRLQETMEADKNYRFTVPMLQQVRELTLVIEPTGGTADRVASITASLSGVAGTLDIDSNAHGSPASVALTFTKGADGKWSATTRLLGVTGNEQKLTGTITFSDSSPDDMSLESDLSTSLAAFNEKKNEPLSLGGTVIETPTGVDFRATITGWKIINGGSVIAN